MPSPSTALTTLRPDLGGSMSEFSTAADRAGFIGLRVLPVFESALASGKYGKIPIEQLLATRETKRASGAGYSRSKFTFTDASFATEEHGAEEVVDDRNSALYANYFDAELIAAERARDVVLRNAEIRIASAVFNPTTWAGASKTTAITNEWDDSINATPIDDVEAAVRKVWDGTGLWPNALIINRKVFRNLRLAAQIIDRIESAGAGNPAKASDITTAMLAAVFDLDYILVAGSGQNTAKEGQSASLSQIWSDEYAMVARIATSNDLSEPCLGRVIHWGEDGSSIGGVIESYRDETVRGDVIRVRHEVDELIMYPECGHLLSNVTT